MSKVNQIQRGILELDGGSFQKLFDVYLWKKYRFENIQTLGVQTGTNKPTKGVPDSYVLTDDGKFILINYGSVKENPVKKIKDDILSCFEQSKLSIPKEKIEKIICGHCSTNIHIEQFSEIKGIIEDVEIELIGIETISYDIAFKYPGIAKDMLGIPIDSNQFFDIDDFVEVYDRSHNKKVNASLDYDLLYRDIELNEICESIKDNKVTILTGASGVGKTRLALEACRKQPDDVKVFCIKNNGNLLYDDIKCYIDTPRKYLLFFDDANMFESFDNVFNIISSYPKEYEIKILITLRDYASERVIDVVQKYSSYCRIEINEFKDNEIKDILKRNLGILNQDYLTRISYIANGNIRLAYLAGIKSKDNGYLAIRNAEEIFKNYYEEIFDKNALIKDDIMILFFIAVSGPIKYNGNQLYNELKKLYEMQSDETNIIERLYNLELVDWFKKEIVKISDQCFGNYILYYVLFEKRWISVEELIVISIPNFRNKLVYALNTLLNVFNSKELETFLKKSINNAWNKALEDQNTLYLEAFCQILPEKSLSVLKNYIDQEKTVDFDLHVFDFDKKNYCNTATKEIEILGNYKYSEYFEDSVDLLLLYFTKRPDLIMDFYFVFSNKLLYDKDSLKHKFSEEKLLLDKLWQSTENGENYNNSILYLQISKRALNTETSFYEEIRNSKSINIGTIHFKFNDDLSDIRTKILKRLGILREFKEYRNIVNQIILGDYYSGLDTNSSKQFIDSDFNAIYENIIAKNSPDFIDARIAYKYKNLAEEVGIVPDVRYQIYENNTDFIIYRLLKYNHIKGRTFEENEEAQKNLILKEIKNYTLDDYRNIFKTCNTLEECWNIQEWSLENGLEYIFRNLEGNSDLYKMVITEYFNNNAPFDLKAFNQIEYLIKHFGYEETYDLLNHATFDKKDQWLSLIWEYLPQNRINEKVIEDYKNFVLNNLLKAKPIIPKIEVLYRYSKNDLVFKNTFTEEIVKHPESAISFLGYELDDSKIEIILKFFEGDFDLLNKIYINAIECNQNVDYDGKLFIKIYDKNPSIWNEYVNWINDNFQKNSGKNHLFDMIWKTENWKDCIDYAYKVLIKDIKGFLLEKPTSLLFNKTQDALVLQREKQWLFDELHKNILNIDDCKILIEVVISVFSEWKLEFIKEFLMHNKKLEDFKKIYLFPLFYSWSGSEIPIILEKIDFLKSLKTSIKGIDYIEHKKYLEEKISDLEKQKERAEVEEYIKNIDFS